MSNSTTPAGFRTEADSMGQMHVPDNAYYGASTARAVENFPVSNLRFSRRFIRAVGLIKKYCAVTNEGLGRISPEISKAVQDAAQEVIDGKLDSAFVVDIFQTGSGTSTNMNANEVIANRAIELRGGTLGDKSVHPNDHVNRGQSSNDVIPTAMHISAVDGLVNELIPALRILHKELDTKAKAFHDVLKIGRTHLQDATPIRLGQEFSGYAHQVALGIARIEATLPRLLELPLGGTAVGTGLNCHPEFAKRTIASIAKETGLAFREADNHFEAQAAKDAYVEASGALKTLAVSLIKIANDIRFLGSGPRCGLGELKLPATQPGSSIMPGKVNPVMSEMLLQICVQVIGNDATVTYGGAFGNFDLNVMMPVMTHNLLESIELLSSGSRIFAKRCIAGLEADEKKCAGYIEESLAMCTALAPVIGYDPAAQIAKTAHKEGRTVRQVALDVSGLDAAALEKILDPATQTAPNEVEGVSAGG